MDSKRLSSTLLFMASSLALLVAVYLLTSGLFSTYEQHSLRARAADYTRLRITRAHLWLEKGMAGDTAIRWEKDVAPLFTSTNDILQKMVAGGKHSLGTFTPEEDTTERDSMQALTRNVEAFEVATFRRWQQRDSTGTGTYTADAVYNRQFEAVLTQIREMAIRHDSQLEPTSLRLRAVIYALLTLSILGLGFSLINRSRLQQQLALTREQTDALRRSELELSQQQQELRASEEELRQNLEEMSATQEEMQRMTQSLEAQNHALVQAQAELEANRNRLEAQRQLEARLAAYADLLRWRPNDTLDTWGQRLMLAIADDLKGLQCCLMMTEEIAGERVLKPVATYACDLENMPPHVSFGEGISGQVATSRRPFWVEDSETTALYSETTSALARISAKAMTVYPLLYNESVEGVMELLFLEPLDEYKQWLLERLAPMLAAQLLTLRNQQRMQRLYQQAERQGFADDLADGSLSYAI